jgi:hypothetical protein
VTKTQTPLFEPTVNKQQTLKVTRRGKPFNCGMNNGEMQSNAPNNEEDTPVKGIARSNTDIANEIRFKTASSNCGKWYEPGIDIWFVLNIASLT